MKKPLLLISFLVFALIKLFGQGESPCNPIDLGVITKLDTSKIGTLDFFTQTKTALTTNVAGVQVPSSSNCANVPPVLPIGCWVKLETGEDVNLITSGILRLSENPIVDIGPGARNYLYMVFSGDDCSSLSQIDCSNYNSYCNDGNIFYNGQEFCVPGAFIASDMAGQRPAASSVFVEPNSTYWLYVYCADDKLNDDFRISLSFFGYTKSENHTCENAIPLISDSNAGGLPEWWRPPGVSTGGNLCAGTYVWATNENTMYYELFATDVTGSVTLTDFYCDDNSNAGDHAQVAIYKGECSFIGDDNSYTNGNFIACGTPTQGESITFSGLTVDEKYYIVIDGNAGSVCKWKFDYTNLTPCDPNLVVDNTISVKGNILTSNEDHPDAKYQWVDCDNGNTPIDGEIGRSYTTTTPGNYAVLLDVRACESVSVCASPAGILGNVYEDLNQDCIYDAAEVPMEGFKLLIEPGGYVAQSDQNGYYSLDYLAAGTYDVTIDTTNTRWDVTCPITQSFTVTDPNTLTPAPDFGVIDQDACPEPDISIYRNRMRVCDNRPVYVSASNASTATAALTSAYTDVTLDPLLTYNGISAGYTATDLGNNVYRVQLGDIAIGQTKTFYMSTTLACDADLLGQTVCMKAELFPVEACVLDTIPTGFPPEVEPCTEPWDKSSISVEGYCANDSIYFEVTNTGDPGDGDMICFSPVRLFIDAEYVWSDSIRLNGGETFTYAWAGDGRTWRLEVDQHPEHPGSSFPNATVELCGSGEPWTPGLVNDLPMDDIDPVVDIYCDEIVGSYDPNDKTGYPNGIGEDHIIYPNGKIEYKIRFQNTGTDTAYYVKILDTLETDLDILTVRSGVSSHDHTFRMYGPRVLEWEFKDIKLVDSLTNEPESHGFVTFTVMQNKDLPDGTVINNDAAIYFDFNDPIITNPTEHVIGARVKVLSVEGNLLDASTLSIAPNPNNGQFNINLGQTITDGQINIYDVTGRIVYQKDIHNQNKLSVDLRQPNGVYMVNIISGDSSSTIKILVE